MRDKNEALKNFIDMIKKSWTYGKLTEYEKRYFEQCFNHSSIKLYGKYEQRLQQLNNMYFAFLSALGYNDCPVVWRATEEEKENNPKF